MLTEKFERNIEDITKAEDNIDLTELRKIIRVQPVADEYNIFFNRKLFY